MSEHKNKKTKQKKLKINDTKKMNCTIQNDVMISCESVVGEPLLVGMSGMTCKMHTVTIKLATLYNNRIQVHIIA